MKHRVLVALDDHDLVRIEHALHAFHVLPKAERAVIPDASHFLSYDRPQKLESILIEFFGAPESRLAFGTIATGYLPGSTR